MVLRRQICISDQCLRAKPDCVLDPTIDEIRSVVNQDSKERTNNTIVRSQALPNIFHVRKAQFVKHPVNGHGPNFKGYDTAPIGALSTSHRTEK